MKAHKDNLSRSGNFPRWWTDPNTGTSYPRKWLEDATLAVQKSLGWYEVVENVPAYNSSIERIVPVSPLVFTGTTIEQNYTVEAIPQAELDAAIQQQEDSDDEAAIKLDAAVKALILARPAGIENYINTNVTTLATAKTVLIILAKAISAIGKREFR